MNTPADNYSRLPSIRSPTADLCFTKFFGILSDLLKILRNLLILLLLVCLHCGCFPYVWQYSVVSFVIFHFEHLIRYVCECLQSSIYPYRLSFRLRRLPEHELVLGQSDCHRLCPKSIQLNHPWSERLLLIP